MSIAAAQAERFFTEIQECQSVWTIRDSGGLPTSTNRSGETAMPFWSLESRARKVVSSVPVYAEFEPYRLTLDEFQTAWLDGLERDGLFVGINWSGKKATGYDMRPAEVRARLMHYSNAKR